MCPFVMHAMSVSCDRAGPGFDVTPDHQHKLLTDRIDSVRNTLQRKHWYIKAISKICCLPLAILALIAGVCAASDGDRKTVETVAVSVSASSAEVTLTAGSWADVKKLAAEHLDKIVIVDIWSTSCLPCMEEFPHLVELQKQHPEKILCISLNVDYAGIKTKPPETYRPRVEKFLKKQEAAFPNFLCTTDAETLFGELKLTSIPAVYVFEKGGQLAKRFDSSLLSDGEEEAFTYQEDIVPFVDKLLSGL